MLVTSQLPIQTTKNFYSFLTCTCAPTRWKRFRHPWLLVHYISSAGCHRLENRKSGTWNLRLKTQLKKVRYAVREHFQKSASSVLLSICVTIFRFAFHSHSSCCCQQETSHLPSWGRPKAASFSEDIYVLYVAYIILKALGFLLAFEESAEWALLSSLSVDSNFYVSTLYWSKHPPQLGKARNRSPNFLIVNWFHVKVHIFIPKSFQIEDHSSNRRSYLTTTITFVPPRLCVTKQKYGINA